MSARPTVSVAVRGVVKRFGSLTAVDGLTLEVPTGTCFGLLGPNGAGKSTLMRLLTGAAVADEGTVEVLGLPMPEASRQVRARSGVVPQSDNLDDELTCSDNLEVYARLYGVRRPDRDAAVDRALSLARLREKADVSIEKLSGGMRRRLLIARVLMHDPDLVLLDEPTVGLDPQIRQSLWSQIDEVRSLGKTTVLTTHYIEEAERLCDEVAIVHQGRLLAMDTPRSLIHTHVGDGGVIEIYGDESRQRRIRQVAEDRRLRFRAAGTSVAVFAATTDALGGNGLRPDDLAHVLRRPGNLEDVFVSLTGEELR